MLRLWNTASRSLEDFTPITDKEVGIYTCGPTVYWDAHIGNLRTYFFEDILQRTLQMEGFDVKRVMNITDVGHLTDDEDAGEDKIEKAAAKEGKTAWDIAKTYTDRFLEDCKALNILVPPAPYLCKATEHITQQIELIKQLETKGYTYQTRDGIYFDTSKFPSYGKLSGQKLSEKEAGARVTVNAEKKNPTDFALWKLSKPLLAKEDFGELSRTGQGEVQPLKRQMEWPSPWGVGFPGWHIECSAMAREYLGQPFDIHCGGIDHIPVHHENEIAQSEAAYGTKLANYWMHGEFLLVDDKKMSKSLGNVYTLKDIGEHKIDPLALRFFFLGAHYRQKQNFTWEALQAAQNGLAKLRHILRNFDVETKLVDSVRTEGVLRGTPMMAEFIDALEEDLNTSKALAVLWKVLGEAVSAEQKTGFIIWADQVLGLSLREYIGKQVEVPAEIQEIVQKREEARGAKDWKTSDQLREDLLAQGWIIEDTKDGARVYPV